MTEVEPTTKSSNNPIFFNDLNVDDEDQTPMQIESYCMNCGENVSFL